ncbi:MULTISPECIES: FtsX-like permease family protein [Actinomycetaceae]|jgi:putative permease domain protein|uniref:FtsX-like permease family protein n=1 Tax=Actinomycetaceae TaxID=2049 RepID=UPI000396C542|nr:FtsX-like permease family protein [Actinobaculum sp. oral taxon 183]ERH19345.1 efflux ABC transporter, permease protein [Actinobaculum sp. oral taxon 183 str. F0552]
MNPALKLAPALTAARLKSRKGDAWLDVLAVVSFAISALMALTVAGGIWMFRGWSLHPTASMLATAHGERSYLDLYLSLGIFAAALLVIPIFSLGTSATRLGAQARARRLASLRLVGVTSGQTVAMTIVETLVQWIIGTGAGVALYFATLPAWRGVEFLKTPIAPSQMVLPAYLLFLVLAALLLITVIATTAGLQRVRISPLGVTRHETSPALKYWRPIAFIAAIAAFWAWSTTNPSTTDANTYLSMALFLGAVIGGISLMAPWVLQNLARLLTRTRSVPRLLAARRIIDNPKAAWRQVSALALLCLIAGYVASIPEVNADGPRADIQKVFGQDVSTGTFITIGFGFAVAALSTLMNQASGVFDRARQTQALTQVGFPRRVFGLTRVYQIIGPLLLTTVSFAFLGRRLALLMAADDVSDAGLRRLAFALTAGIVLSLLALLACEPLESHVLASQRRRND